MQRILSVDVTTTSEQLMDDSKKYKWGAKKLNYIVLSVWILEVDVVKEICTACLHCNIHFGCTLFPLSIDCLLENERSLI